MFFLLSSQPDDIDAGDLFLSTPHRLEIVVVKTNADTRCVLSDVRATWYSYFLISFAHPVFRTLSPLKTRSLPNQF